MKILKQFEATTKDLGWSEIADNTCIDYETKRQVEKMLETNPETDLKVTVAIQIEQVK